MKKVLAALLAAVMVLSLAACGGSAAPAATESPAAATAAGSDVPAGLEDGVLTIAMECAYAPYNWTQTDDSNGAVPIANVPGPYFYATIVCVTKADGKFANATSIADLAGGSCTAQIATIWYDQCLPQIKDAAIQTAAETAPAMLMALETDTVDFICTDMPTAQGAVAAYPDMKILDFSGTDGDFQFSDEVRAENVNIGVSVMKGNTLLKDKIDAVLSTMTPDDMNALMEQAIAVQPLSED